MPKRVIGKHKAFLKAFACTGSITLAAKAAKVDRGQHYEWLRTRSGYPAEFEESTMQAAQLLEDEAVRRAHQGVFEPNVYQGEFVYPELPIRNRVLDPETGKQKRYPLTMEDGDGNTVPHPEAGKLVFVVRYVRGKHPLGLLKYSDSLLMFLLRGLRPDRYRERTEVTGKDGGPIETKVEVIFVKAKQSDDPNES